jgi:soluble calcium-activated nucleotidase 1
MSTTDREEPLYKMQEEGSAPMMDTVPDDSVLSPTSMDETLQPCKIVVDMKVVYERQSADSTSEMSHTSEPTPLDGISEAGISKNGSTSNHREAVRRRSSWMSAALAPGGLSLFIATCTVLSMNAFSVYLPVTFAQGGMLLTSIVLVAVVLQTNIATSFLLEASARAQALDLLMPNGILPRHYSLKIRERKYELSLLTSIFLGRKWTLFFTFTTLACKYGFMWAFCTIFANAFADKFTLGDVQDGGYIPYVVMFMAVTVPLSCTSLADQQWIQVEFVTARLVMVILMVGTAAAACNADEPHFGSQVGPVNGIPLAKASNIIQVTMTCIFASFMQFAVPTMADETRNKTGLSRVFGHAPTLSCISNLLLGILFAIFFGQVQPDTANLNWVNCHGGTAATDPAACATRISSHTTGLSKGSSMLRSSSSNSMMHWGGAVRAGYFSVADSVVSDTEILFAAVTDMDELSRVKDSRKPKFRSIFLPGKLLKKNGNSAGSKTYEIVLDDTRKRTLFTQRNEAGRGGEFSELTIYNNRLLTFDDRTGDVFEILNDGSGTGSHVAPRFVITEGSGESDKGMKWEWATVKDDELIMGSTGKEYTRPDGSVVNRNNLWIAGLNSRGELRRTDWTQRYDVVRKALNARLPGYLVIEAVNWSPILKKWVFLPRRISSEMYNENKDERMGGNKLVLVDEHFTSATVVEIKMSSAVMDPLKGFSTFAFVPGTGDRHALAARSVEEDCVGGDDQTCKQRSYFMVFDVLTGEVLSKEVQAQDLTKFEGLEFVNMFTVPK